MIMISFVSDHQMALQTDRQTDRRTDVPSLKEAYVYNGGVKVDELEYEYFINELVLELRLRAVHL